MPYSCNSLSSKMLLPADLLPASPHRPRSNHHRPPHRPIPIKCHLGALLPQLPQPASLRSMSQHLANDRRRATLHKDASFGRQLALEDDSGFAVEHEVDLSAVEVPRPVDVDSRGREPRFVVGESELSDPGAAVGHGEERREDRW